MERVAKLIKFPVDLSDYLVQHFWKERTFWSDGYFACSIRNVSKEIIQKYIQTQGN